MTSQVSESAGTGEYFAIEFDQAARAAILRLRGEVDLSTSGILSAACRELVLQGHIDLIIDAEGITFIDASGVRTLLECQELVGARGGSLSLIASPTMSRLLDLVNLDSTFSTYVTVEAATGSQE